MKVWLKTGRKRRPPHHCKHFAAVLVWKPGFSLVHVSHLHLRLRLYRFPRFRSYLYRGKDATYPKKRILYSLSAVLNKVLWYHWAEVLTHTHTHTQTGDTLSLSMCLHTSCALPPHILTVTLGPMGSHLHVEQNSLLLFTSQMLRVDMTTLAALITSDWAAAGGSKSYGHRALY